MNSSNKKLNLDELLAKVQDVKTRKTIASCLCEQGDGCMTLYGNIVIDDLFDIGNCYYQDNQIKHGPRLKAIASGQYDQLIAGGVYNAIMPCKNTYFHSAIASDLTKQTLILLRHIDSVAKKYKVKLENLVPFDSMDCYSGDCRGKYVSKNFLMLAIAKKYDTNISFAETMTGKTMSTSFTEEEWKSYKEKYQKNDAELIKWLIEKAPDSCIKQKDSEGYNLFDYALMKMDNDILKQLLERDKTLILDSKLLKQYPDLTQFNYSKACEMAEKRYRCPLGIAYEMEWLSQKSEVVGTIKKALGEVIKVNNNVGNSQDLTNLNANSGYYRNHTGEKNDCCITF